MKIRIDGKEIYMGTHSIVEIVVEEKDTVKMTTLAKDKKDYTYVTSCDSRYLSIRGGASLIEEIPFPEAGSLYINTYTRKMSLDMKPLDKSSMYKLSMEIFPKIIRQLLDNSKIKYENIKYDGIEIFRVDRSNSEFFEQLVYQCIEYRCSNSVKDEGCNVLKQLPMHIAIQESDKLIILDKKHSIYSCVRGGYNIRVRGYANEQLSIYSSFCYKSSD